MKFSFSHTPKPRAFDYRPRYYDPAKEEWEMKKKELLGSDYQAKEEREYRPGQYIGELRIRRGIIANRDKKQRQQKRTLRSLIFLVLLVAFAYWLIKTDFSNSIWAVFLSGQ
jgi:hypothetical protein